MSLTRTTEPPDTGVTASPGTDVWRVEWTEVRNGKADTGTKSHYTETAARSHVEGLLRMRITGLSIDAIFTDHT